MNRKFTDISFAEERELSFNQAVGGYENPYNFRPNGISVHVGECSTTSKPTPLKSIELEETKSESEQKDTIIYERDITDLANFFTAQLENNHLVEYATFSMSKQPVNESYYSLFSLEKKALRNSIIATIRLFKQQLVFEVIGHSLPTEQQRQDVALGKKIIIIKKMNHSKNKDQDSGYVIGFCSANHRYQEIDLVKEKNRFLTIAEESDSRLDKRYYECENLQWLLAEEKFCGPSIITNKQLKIFILQTIMLYNSKFDYQETFFDKLRKGNPKETQVNSVEKNQIRVFYKLTNNTIDITITLKLHALKRFMQIIGLEKLYLKYWCSAYGFSCLFSKFPSNQIKDSAEISAARPKTNKHLAFKK